MTTSNVMSLPVDIPWERIATSTDMIDRNFGDRKYPAKWRPSVTVFCYEPPEDEQKLDDSIVTYLKISCSITGLENPLAKSGARVTVPPKYLASHPWAIKYWKTRNRKIIDYYPCHGALLQVAVFPNDQKGQVPVSKYPVVMDFQPKKREMYYSQTEKTDVLSTSRSSIEVKKGTTTTLSQETGWNLGGGASVGSDSGSASFGGGYSSKTTSSVQNVNMVTADKSREKRENFSYVSELTHMYHLLNSYHLGTNRAMFFLQPRPFISQSEFSFVNGLRKLEGIQEFFLIITRPKDVQGLCVEATLETAHFQVERTYNARIITKSQLQQGKNLMKTASALGLTSSEMDGAKEAMVKAWNQITAEVRQLLEFYFDVAVGYTFKTVNDLRKSKGLTPISRKDWDSFKKLRNEVGKESYDPSQTAVVIYEKSQADTGILFVLGRGVASCIKEFRVVMLPPDSLVFEKRIPLDNVTLTESQKDLVDEEILPIVDIPLSMVTANTVSQAIGDNILASLSAPERFAYGDASLDEALFIQEPLVAALNQMPDDDPYNAALENIDGLEEEVVSALVEIFGAQTRKDALAIEPYQVAAALGISEAEVRKLRTIMMGEGPLPSLEVGEAPFVAPDLEGLTEDGAQQALQAQMLALHPEVSFQDSLEPQGTIIQQYPAAGSLLKRGDLISIILSSGPVIIPDVTGMETDAAVAMLAELGLSDVRSPVVSRAQKPGRVVAVLPEPGTEITRGSSVVLQIAQAPEDVAADAG